MTQTMFRKKILCLACCAAIPLSAASESVEERVFPFYVSGMLGIARGQVDSRAMDERMLSLGYDIQADVDNLTRVAWGAALGYQWLPYLATEVGYVNLGSVRTQLTGAAVDIDDYLNSANMVHPRSASGLEAALVGQYPLSENTHVFARGGLLFGDSRYRANDGANFSTRSSNDNIVNYGIGIGYQLDDDWRVRAGLSRYHLDGERVALAGLSLQYQFRYTRRKAAPVEIIPEPVPAPVVIPTTNLVVTFETDSARVDERYYPGLRELAALMREHPEIDVVLSGHTDNRGGATYNMGLSERRAQAVQELLVEGLGIDPARVSTRAYGLTNPIADDSHAQGRAANRRVTAEIIIPSE